MSSYRHHMRVDIRVKHRKGIPHWAHGPRHEFVNDTRIHSDTLDFVGRGVYFATSTLIWIAPDAE